MCGIAGIVVENAERQIEILNDMLFTLARRGPDSTGKYFFPNCILGHRRLSVIDLNSGSQPMITKKRQLGITFNGEIYGYRDIRKSLTDYVFETASDTEVILALYEKYGYSMTSYLPGMFAFALWDETKQELFCVRDRFGEKPFFYSIGENGEFIFASEIKSLIASKIIKPKLRMESLAHYLRRGYIHPSHTIYSNIYSLPPAHTLRFRNGKISIERYWYFPEGNLSISPSDAVEKFKELLTRAIQRQLVADVDVGAFLSGGVDSTSIVAIASQYCDDLRTYTFGYKGRSELPYADAVANQFHTNHYKLMEEDLNIADLLIKMQWVYDEPFHDSAMIPTYLISELACQHGKVILTGDGADELLGGYPWLYYRCLDMERIKFMLARSSDSSSGNLNYLLNGNVSPIEDYKSKKSYKDLNWAKNWNSVEDHFNFATVIKLHLLQNSILTDEELRKLGLGSRSDDAAMALRSWEPSNTTDDALRLDLEDYLAGDILVKTDRASMAHGLELRSPFLDRDLASFCISLPLNMKITLADDKLILRQSFSSQWPELIKKRSKQGFGAPLDRWLQKDSVQALKREYLDNPQSKIFHVIPYTVTRELLKENYTKTWLLLVLALWADTHAFET